MQMKLRLKELQQELHPEPSSTQIIFVKKKKIKSKLKKIKTTTQDLNTQENGVVGNKEEEEEVKEQNLVLEEVVVPNTTMKIDEKLLYAKFKNESDWLKAVLKERKSGATMSTATTTTTLKY
jgi:hypothetical protein